MNQIENEFLSLREAAKFLGFRPIVVKAMCESGKLDFIESATGIRRISKTSILIKARQNAEEARAKQERGLFSSYRAGNYTKLLV
jgi:hypothetical protein